MTAISEIEESDRDWDWFAVDPAGYIGHFTTAGLRTLPKTVKQDKEAALALISYFFDEAPKRAGFTVRPGVESDAGGWADEEARNRYLGDFIRMASAGLFSYDTPTFGPKEDYFLVASPKSPLRISQLPAAIHDLVQRTKSPSAFSGSDYIAAIKTHEW